MQRAFEKIIEKLSNKRERCEDLANQSNFDGYAKEEAEYLAMTKMCDNAIEIVNQVASEYGGGWIPVSSGKLPEDCDNRFYMCIVENHEEDLPMFCQYDEEYGFGFWHDIYDEHTLGFVDSEFKTNKELGYEEVIAWQPLPEPYKAESEER